MAEVSTYTIYKSIYPDNEMKVTTHRLEKLGDSPMTLDDDG